MGLLLFLQMKWGSLPAAGARQLLPTPPCGRLNVWVAPLGSPRKLREVDPMGCFQWCFLADALWTIVFEDSLKLSGPM